MRGLFGDFETMPLSDLVVYLGNKRATGVLTLEREAVRKQVSLRRGMIMNASSNAPREYLGQFLINLGHITEEQFNRAYETQKETKIYLGKILVMIGAVDEQTVINALSLKFRETLLEAFHWTQGTFNYDAQTEPANQEGLDLEIDLLDVHREGEFRTTAWESIRAAFPSGKVRLELVGENLPEAPAPGSLDEKLFAYIRDGRSIDEMVLALHATDFYLYQRLYALYRLEAVRVAGSVELDIVDEEPIVGMPFPEAEASPADLLAHAEAFLAAGNYQDAEAIARKAHEILATSSTADLLHRAEAQLTQQLREALLEGGKIPAVLVPLANLKGLQMTAPERYLLSRIDGKRPVASIVQVSPLRELDALKFFSRFIDAGLVKVA
jgi:hypothetical protein